MNIYWNFMVDERCENSLIFWVCLQAYSDHYKTSNMEFFAKIVDGLKLLTIFLKNWILDVWQGSEYASVAGGHQ